MSSRRCYVRLWDILHTPFVFSNLENVLFLSMFYVVMHRCIEMHVDVYASGGKTARVDVRIFSFFHSFSILTRFHVLACHLVDGCFSGVLGGGGGGGVITSWKCELCLRRWVLKMFHVRRSTLFYWCVQFFMSVFINVHPDLFHVLAWKLYILDFLLATLSTF